MKVKPLHCALYIICSLGLLSSFISFAQAEETTPHQVAMLEKLETVLIPQLASPLYTQRRDAQLEILERYIALYDVNFTPLIRQTIQNAIIRSDDPEVKQALITLNRSEVARLEQHFSQRGEKLDLFFFYPDLKHFGAVAEKILLGQTTEINSTFINRANIGGNTLLMTATDGCPLEFIRYLLDSGADLNAKTTDDFTPLHIATSRGNIEIVKLLVERGASIEPKHREGITPLMWGIDSPTVVQYLLHHGANVNAADEKGYTSLMYAINPSSENSAPERLETVRILLDHKALVNAQENFGEPEDEESDTIHYIGRTPLMLAAWRGQTGVVKLLLEHDADVNIKSPSGRTALMWGTASGLDYLGMDFLLSTPHIDVNAQDIHGMTALMLAAENVAHPTIIELLLSKGADPSLTDINEMTAREIVEENRWLPKEDPERDEISRILAERHLSDE